MNKTIDVEIKELETKLKKLKEQKALKEVDALREPFNLHIRQFSSLRVQKRSLERMERALEISLGEASEDFFTFIETRRDAILGSPYYINFLYWGTDFSVSKIESALGIKTGELSKLAETSSDRVSFGITKDEFYHIESLSASGKISRWYRDNKFTIDGGATEYYPTYIKVVIDAFDETFIIIERRFISDKLNKV